MHLNKQLVEKTRESMASVLPVTAIVFLLSITAAPLEPGTLVLFLLNVEKANAELTAAKV